MNTRQRFQGHLTQLPRSFGHSGWHVELSDFCGAYWGDTQAPHRVSASR